MHIYKTRELSNVLPSVRHHGSSDMQPGIQMQMAHSLAQHHHHQQQQQHQRQQHQSSLPSSQTSHQHQQSTSHHQSILTQSRQEPISPHHHQISHSPHHHASMSPHPHPHPQQHPSLSTSHGLDVERQSLLGSKSTSSLAPSSSSMQLHSQGVNTSESAAEIASSSQRSHLCTTCLKGFRSKQQLIQHSLVHTNIRKYSCSYCDRSFKQLSHLQQHTRIHTAEKGTEKVEDQRSFRCQYCQRAFKQLIHLQQHTRLHTGEKPYACKYEDCDRAFAQMSNLQHHMRNHEEQVKKEVLRIHKCHICHRSYTNDSSLRAHTMKMHMHMRSPEDLNAEDQQPVKKRRKKKNKQLSAPTMVPLGEGEGSRREGGSTDPSSDEDVMIMGNRKEHGIPSTIGSIPRNLMESLNQYERTLAAGMNGEKVHGGNLSSAHQSSLLLGATASSAGGGSRDRDSLRPSTSLGLMGLPGMDSALMSSQGPDVVERAAAAAAAAVSNQLLQHGHGRSTPISSSLSSSGVQPPPHPQPAHSHLMEAHLRNQVTPITLAPLHDQYYGHTGPPPPLGMLSPHAHILGPPRSMADLPMTYGSQISSAASSAMVTSSHLTVPSAPPHTSSRPPSALSSPHHVSEALNFNH
ncbi:uncharacterized protein LOC143287765 isoform X2 [Babylonia areolata]|uniref:uncharacterized protein LOC143287765 isoform X2 n=1 Tax=Babylonia areolata TaxID=304850 RepID=UPI003FD416BF